MLPIDQIKSTVVILNIDYIRLWLKNSIFVLKSRYLFFTAVINQLWNSNLSSSSPETSFLEWFVWHLFLSSFELSFFILRPYKETLLYKELLCTKLVLNHHHITWRSCSSRSIMLRDWQPCLKVPVTFSIFQAF